MDYRLLLALTLTKSHSESRSRGVASAYYSGLLTRLRALPPKGAFRGVRLIAKRLAE
jgi:hypothetical protein